MGREIGGQMASHVELLVGSRQANIEMEADEISVCTSVDGDDKTDFGDNPTRDSLTDGLISLLRPTVESLENSIRNTK